MWNIRFLPWSPHSTLAWRASWVSYQYTAEAQDLVELTKGRMLVSIQFPGKLRYSPDLKRFDRHKAQLHWYQQTSGTAWWIHQPRMPCDILGQSRLDSSWVPRSDWDSSKSFTAVLFWTTLHHHFCTFCSEWPQLALHHPAECSQRVSQIYRQSLVEQFKPMHRQ